MKYMRSLVAVLFISFNLSAQDPALTVFNQVTVQQNSLILLFLNLFQC